MKNSTLRMRESDLRTLVGSLAIGFFCAGCASMITHTAKKEEGVYPGVREDAHLLTHPNSIRKPPIHPVIVVTFSLIDMRLSAALDTILLPIDLT